MNRPSLAPTGLGLLLLSLLAVPACSGGSSGPKENRGTFAVSLVSTGLGQVFPYRIRQADQFGNPTATVLNIDNIEVLKANLTPNNDVLPVATLETTAILPDGSPGNHFIQIQFTHLLGLNSILSDLLANQTNSGLTTSISVIEYDPATEKTKIASGRGFVGGMTYFNRGGALQLVQAVAEDGAGSVVVLDPEADGFPRGFSGDVDLVSPKSFVFVADNDDDLSTFDTFPANRLLQIIIGNAVRNSQGKILSHEVCTATTVGVDPNPPDVVGAIAGQKVGIAPGNGEANVDPTTPILVQFNKPVQPGDVGAFFNPSNLIPASGGVTLNVTQAANTFSVIYYADPLGFGDFCNYIIRPAYNLPGQSTVDLSVNNLNVRGLTGQNLGMLVQTNFSTSDGPGITNAPVAPEALYIGIGGPNPGVSIIDLNGFGQGTGDLLTTRFPFNPNIGAPGVDPPLAPGDSSLDAGGAGVFSLAEDSVGNTLLIQAPLVGTIGDIQIGNPLDMVFNNQNINRNSNVTNQTNPVSGNSTPGNTISIAPHPNPPRLRFPPPNPARAIFGEEPTATSSTGPGITVTAPPCAVSALNLLNVGNPFSSQVGELGLIGAGMPGVFYGPQQPPPSPPPPTPLCNFTSRQQVGHFLYVLDRDQQQVLIVNSNRMTVLDSIRVVDPIDMAIAPNLRTLAVTSFSGSQIIFIDINPFSATFHQRVGLTRIDGAPTKVVWQPDGETVLVISPVTNVCAILSGLDFTVIKTVSGFLNDPVDIVATQRYVSTGYLQGVYYAYILNADGTIAILESGPDGVNGIGFRDIIGTIANISFNRATRLILDPTSANGAVLVAHKSEQGLGQVSRLELTTSPTGPQPINQFQGGFIIPPTFRQKAWTVVQQFGGENATTPARDLLSGNSIVDIALDEVRNIGASIDQITQFNQIIPFPPGGHSGKGVVKTPALAFATFGTIATAPYFPQYMFVGLGDAGVIDVLEVNSGKRVTSIPAPGVQVISQYWRQ